MKGISTKEELMKRMQKCGVYKKPDDEIFWGEEWAVSIMEQILNVKLILFDKRSYEQGDMNQVLLCGMKHANAPQVFRPKYYIMLDYWGNHYINISYKGKSILTFEEIPFQVKELIIQRCKEGESNNFFDIPKFKQYIKEREVEESESANEEDYSDGEESEIDTEERSGETTPDELYDDEVTFQFYDKSNDKPLPGTGNGEKIEKTLAKEFILFNFKDWNVNYQMLMNHLLK